MKRAIQAKLLMTVLILVSLTACGGGGGAAPSYTKAIVTLSTAGTGTLIYGIQVTVNLPAGVTAKASLYSAGSSSIVDAGVITATGTAAGSYTSGAYLAGAASSTYKITMDVFNANGFSGPGEFAQVTCDITAGSSPSAAGFSLSNFEAVDGGGVSIPGFTSGFTVTFQ